MFISQIFAIRTNVIHTNGHVNRISNSCCLPILHDQAANTTVATNCFNTHNYLFMSLLLIVFW